MNFAFFAPSASGSLNPDESGLPDADDALREALRSYAAGMGFADALHLALSAGEQQFMTFDKAFAGRAKKMGLKPDVVLA